MVGLNLPEMKAAAATAIPNQGVMTIRPGLYFSFWKNPPATTPFLEE